MIWESFRGLFVGPTKKHSILQDVRCRCKTRNPKHSGEVGVTCPQEHILFIKCSVVRNQRYRRNTWSQMALQSLVWIFHCTQRKQHTPRTGKGCKIKLPMALISSNGDRCSNVIKHQCRQTCLAGKACHWKAFH